MTDSKLVSNPCDDTKLVKAETDINQARQSLYLSIVGSLMWAAMSIQPNIAFVVGFLSRFNQNPSKTHLLAAKRVLQYLKGTIDYGLTLRGNIGDTKLIGYCDADYAGDIETR